MATATPLMIPVDKIVVQEGHNARKSFDPKALKRLGKSISANDLIEPLSVRPIDGGKFMLLAGERRLRAAKLEGIKELPGHINTKGNARTIALVENIQREQLNKVEEAEGVEQLAKELKLTTNKAIAEEIGMSDKWVSVRRRILTLPKKVQDAIARDAVSIEAVSLLKKAADASPRIAECVCEVFEKDEAYTDFVRDFSDMLTAVADGAVDDPPTMIDPDHIRFSEVFDEAQERDKHAARYRAAVPTHVSGPQGDPSISLGEAEMTVARAGRVLLEHTDESGSYSYTTKFLVDKTWGKDLVLSAIERAEKEKKRREKEEKKRAKEADASSDNGNDPSTSKVESKWAKEREAAKKAAEERREAAVAFNDRLNHALMKHRTVENRRKYGLPRAKATAIALVLHDRNLAAAGLRLVMPQLQQSQTGDDGSGAKTAKVGYATTTQARDFLIGKIEGCKSIAEVHEWIAIAQIAAALADEDAVKAGEGFYRHDPAEAKVKELLAEEIKTVKPRRSPKQRKEEKETATV